MSRSNPTATIGPAPRWAGVSVTVLVLALTVAACGSRTNPLAPPTKSPGRSEKRVKRGDFGIAAGGAFLAQSRSAIARELDGYVAIGAKWLRFDFDWARIEPADGVFDWGEEDAAVAAARARKLSILGTLTYTPPWAQGGGTNKFDAPSSPEDFAEFARTVVDRYARKGVHAWEIWNEPNHEKFWKPCPSPAAYAALLEATYPTIKGADPSATVVFGGMAPVTSNGCSINPRAFLKAAYASGARGSFDALGYHPYTYPAPPGGFGNDAWTQMYLTAPSLLGIMAQHGDRAKKIWGTEWGDPAGRVSEATQARDIRKVYALWTRYSWTGPLFTFSYRNVSGFGLLRSNGSRRPAWYAYRRATGAG